jgi:sensor domain CHASE-containing protein
MDTNMFLQLLGSYAFPIVACIFMAIYVKDMSKSNREDTKALNDQHTKEMNTFKDEIKEALNNNTISLTRLCERLEREEARSNEVK